MEADEQELEDLLGSLDKLSKNQTVDIFSCVECGRCTEVCPAHRGGGTLDPKNHFILNLKDHLLSNQLDAVNKIDVPPMLISGNVCPVTGKTPTETSILIKAWNTKLNIKPTHNSPPKTLVILVAILKDL